MCFVSMVGDGYKKDFPQNWPQFPIPQQDNPCFKLPSEVSKADFDALKKEVQGLKKLLQAAAAFDKATGQPHCEMDDKVKLIKQIAKIVGVDLEGIFDEEKPNGKKPANRKKS